MYELKFLNEVIANFLDKNEQFFQEKQIDWSTKGEYTIFNYRQGCERNDYNNWCRALVLDSKGRVASLPFPRFFNRGEKEAPNLNHKRCQFLEKLDGTLLAVFFDDDHKPVLHTRRTISTHEADWNMEITTFNGKKASLLKLAHEYLKNVEWWEDDYDCCFAFELVHDSTHVVTNYPAERWGMYLIGGRHLDTMEEMFEAELLAIANEMNKKPGVNIMRPHDWRFDDENELQSVLVSMPDDFEGFVAREIWSGRRVKIKKLSYMERHRLLSEKQNLRSVIAMWLRGEREQIMAYFTDTEAIFKKLDEAYGMFLDTVRGIVLVYQQWVQEKNWARKDLAAVVIKGEPKWLHHFIFRLYDKPWDDQNVWEMLKARLPDVRTVQEWLFGEPEEEEDADVGACPEMKCFWRK